MEKPTKKTSRRKTSPSKSSDKSVSNTPKRVAKTKTKPMALTIDQVLARVVDKNGNKLLDEQQISELLELKFSDNVEILSIQTSGDKGFTFDIIWLIDELGYEAVYEFLAKDWEKLLKLEEATNEYKRRRILYENPIFGKNRDNLLIELFYFKNPVLISEGAVECRKCGSKETLSASKQTRSADEPTDIKVTCLHCGEHWKVQ